METFLLKVLSCPSNVTFLNKILEEKLALQDFATFSLEFPLYQEENYGFVDVFGVGKIKESSKYVFIEAKSKFSGAKREATEDLKIYSYFYSKFGLFSDAMTRLYHQIVFNANNHVFNPRMKGIFLPLIVYPELIEAVSNCEIEKVITDYASFIGRRISQRIPSLTSFIDSMHEENLVPRYPNIVRKNNEVVLVFYCYDYEGNSLKKVIPWEGIDKIPMKERADLNNKELFDILLNQKGKERRFLLHYSLNGYHRPNLFLEAQMGKFLCFQHIGLGSFNYMGIYDENAALDHRDSLIYSTLLVDKGNYRVIKAGNQVVHIYLTGKEFHGILRISFGASISFRTKFKFERGHIGLDDL